MKSSLKRITFAVAAATLLAAGTASAERPANLAGTTWLLQTNQDPVLLVINTQGGPGAPGAATCRSIHGDIGNVAHIRGWYCPSTGRIHFVHRNLDSGDAVRVFTGNVSDFVLGQPLSMAGTMTVLFAAFGDLGEYSFSATSMTTWGSAPHPGSVACGAPAPRRFLAGAPCAPPLCGNENKILVRSRIAV